MQAARAGLDAARQYMSAEEWKQAQKQLEAAQKQLDEARAQAKSEISFSEAIAVDMQDSSADTADGGAVVAGAAGGGVGNAVLLARYDRRRHDARGSFENGVGQNGLYGPRHAAQSFGDTG